jgi:hypothetical protein
MNVFREPRSGNFNKKFGKDLREQDKEKRKGAGEKSPLSG